MLTIVQYEEELTGAQDGLEVLDRRAAGLLPDPEGSSNGVGDEVGVRQRGQLDVPDSVRERWQHPGRHLLGQPRLAHSAGADERHEPCAPQQPHDLGRLCVAPDEAGDLQGEVAAWGFGRQKLRRRDRHDPSEREDPTVRSLLARPCARAESVASHRTVTPIERSLYRCDGALRTECPSGPEGAVARRETFD